MRLFPLYLQIIFGTLLFSQDLIDNNSTKMVEVETSRKFAVDLGASSTSSNILSAAVLPLPLVNFTYHFQHN